MNEALKVLFNSLFHLNKTLIVTNDLSFINLQVFREFHPIAWFMIAALICICFLLFSMLFKINRTHQTQIKQMKTDFDEQINQLKKQFFLDEENGSAIKLKTYVKKENGEDEVKGQHGKVTSDEKLLKNAIAYVKLHLESPDLSVEEMSRQLGLSRTHLHRKLKQLTGQTPIEFIKTLRLKYAAKLLETGQMSVSEVCYKVGYNTPSYFSSSFTAYFKMPPVVYMEKAIQKNKENEEIFNQIQELTVEKKFGTLPEEKNQPTTESEQQPEPDISTTYTDTYTELDTEEKETE